MLDDCQARDEGLLQSESTPERGRDSEVPPSGRVRRERRLGNAVALARGSYRPARTDSIRPDTIMPPPLVTDVRPADPPREASRSESTRHRGVVTALMAGLGVTVGIAGALAGAFALAAVSQTGATHTTNLAVQVTSSEGTPAADARVFLDGELRCSGSLCRLKEVEPGPHLVRVQRGHRVVEQQVTVPDHGTGQALIALDDEPQAPVAKASAVAAAPPAPSTGAPAAPESSIPKAGTTAARAHQAAPRLQTAALLPPTALLARGSTTPAATTKPTAMPAGPPPLAPRPQPTGATLGTLRIASNPASNIVINGKPAGVRSSLRARVEPGTHVIAFVRGGGRKVRTVRVEPGATVTAAVSFP